MGKQRPRQTAGILQLPKEIWLQIIDNFVVQQNGGVDSFPDFNWDSEDAIQNRMALLTLSLTCTALRDISQEALFRYAVIAVYFTTAELATVEQLFEAIHNARPSLQAAVQAITFSLSMDKKYHSVLSRLPNLTHLDITRTWYEPFWYESTSVQLQLATLLAQNNKLSHIRYWCATDECYGDLERLHLPPRFRGHLFLRNLNLCGQSEAQAPQYCMFPNISSLCLSLIDNKEEDNSFVARQGLAQIVGTSSGQNITSFTLECSTIYRYESYLSPLIHAFGSSVQEFTYISDTIGDRNWDIGGLRNLRKLGLSGNALTSLHWVPTSPLYLPVTVPETDAYPTEIVNRIPTSVKILRIDWPAHDVFHVALRTLLPRLTNLHSLELSLGQSTRPFRALVNEFHHRRRSDYAYGVVQRPSYELQEILDAAGELDRICGERSIATRPSSFQKALQQELETLRECL